MRLATLVLSVLLLIPHVADAKGEPSEAKARVESVLLLHGLGRSSRAMQPLATLLSEAGYAVHNVSYPSTDLAPDELNAYLHEQVVVCCEAAPRLHFVTHSLGGILVRAYLATHDVPALGRVVMLAPPNRGSELVDVLDSPAFRWALGPTASQLGTDQQSLPNRLPAPNFELGVIAGTSSINPLGSIVVPGESDGTVSVESTRLPGMTDFIAIPASHTFIMRSKAAGSQVLEFLKQGRFKHPES